MKSTFSGLQFCRRQYGSISIRLAVVAFQNREITRNSDKIWPYSSSASSKVIDLGVNRKHRCDFLLVINSMAVSATIFEILTFKSRKCLVFLPLPCLTPPLWVTPFEFCDEIWRQKTRIVTLPDDEEITTFFVLTQYRRVTDRWTDAHVAVAKTRAIA